jgi:hypothetical protein
MSNFKIGDMVAHTGPAIYEELVEGHVYEVIGIISDGPAHRILLAGVDDRANTGWLASRFTMHIRAQDERDDWWTKRIDPYDDRIRALERWRYNTAVVAEFKTSQYKNVASPDRDTSLAAERSVALADLEEKLKVANATNLRFAQLITEYRARLGAVKHVLETPIALTGEQQNADVPTTYQTVRQPQQTSTL